MDSRPCRWCQVSTYLIFSIFFFFFCSFEWRERISSWLYILNKYLGVRVQFFLSGQNMFSNYDHETKRVKDKFSLDLWFYTKMIWVVVRSAELCIDILGTKTCEELSKRTGDSLVINGMVMGMRRNRGENDIAWVSFMAYGEWS